MVRLTSFEVEGVEAATIRDLREARGWSVRQAAERAGIGRSTLSRWERGEARPSRPELARYYAAFGRPLPAPTWLQHLPVPVSRADLLRALRGRRGLSLEDAAERLGLSKPVLSRYESGARAPAPDLAAHLAQALGASPDEAAAVRDGEVRLPMRLVTREDAHAQVIRLADAAETGGRDLDLPFLALDAWLRRAGEDEARLSLSAAYIRWLGWWYRDREADRWARRDIGLLAHFPHVPAWGRIGRARAVYVAEFERQPRAATEILREIAAQVCGQSSEGQVCRELAGMLTGIGAWEDALATLDRARQASPGDESASEHAFCCDAVEAGLWAARGHPERALRLAFDRLPKAGFLRYALAGSRADALVQVGEAPVAIRELGALAQDAHAADFPHFAAGLERRAHRIAALLS